MPINTLQYAEILQNKLDQQMMMGLVTGFMDANAGDVKYTGGDTVKIPSVSLQGLGDYDRDKGFVQGAVTLKYETMKMTQDRGRTFHLDSQDVDETNFLVSASLVASEFQRTQVIPEIDSYRLSKLYAEAKKKSQVLENYDPAEDTILKKLTEHIVAVKDIIGTNEEVVILMTSNTKAILSEALKNNRRLDIGNFQKGAINLQVHRLDENPIMPVPSARFKTLYKSNDGKTGGQEAGGLVPDSGAKDINWIIVPKRVPIAVCKQDKLRIFEPDTNQQADAWKIDYRKYHELWVKANQAVTIFASSKA